MYSIIYEIAVFILALVAVTLTILDLNNRIVLEARSTLYWIDTGILVFFTIDYFFRFIISKDKVKFFKSNIFDLIAIIPFNSMFRIFRTFRLVKVVRITKTFKMAKLLKGVAFLGKIKGRLNVFINTNGFIYTLYISVTSIMLGTIGIYFLEFKTIGLSFEDSLWWSFVTASTVGYGEIVPVTIPGRIIAVILMLIGIGFVGMLTGTIATYFMRFQNVPKENEEKLLIDVSELEDDKVELILDYIEFIRARN